MPSHNREKPADSGPPPAPETWQSLNAAIIACERCPRLRAYCQHIAQQKKAAFRQWVYWGRPVPNFGDPNARLLIVGLAPAAHGANRTGRSFTGDRSGEFLYRAMFETGFANQPTSTDVGDGLTLTDAAITAAVRCAPPDNKPSPLEIQTCNRFVVRTIDALPRLRGIVALGRIGFDACVRQYVARQWLSPGQRKPSFGHNMLFVPDRGPFLLACYHPSQQNTFTGRLTAAMLRDVFCRARDLLPSEPARQAKKETDANFS